ncbi:amidohydrolase [Bradyrhizobium sp. ISRA442]|uniref:amidohydrolase n=1 Tax=Bradyrhizobium sp. ISRA442 TaxID=2866197 RepID=UPI00311AEF2B
MTRSMTHLLVLALLASASAANAADVAVTRAAIDRGLDSQYAHIEALYKDIHSHPELGFQETHTAALLAGEMRKLGFDVTEHVGKTGIVAILKNGPGPLVMLRTELDALPMLEKTGLPYASTATQMYKGAESPVAHSCGHDIHMAVWAAVAKTMVDMKDQWSGTLMFVGQPAAEGDGGAKAMLADGLFTRFGKPDMGFALHVNSGPFGTVSYKPGVINSTSDGLTIVFKGTGGHGSRPHVTIDPVMMAAHFIVDVQSVISREKDASKFGVVTIGAVQAGNAGNVIPDTALLRGTIRSWDNDTRAKMLTGVERTAKGVAMMAGAPEPDIKLSAGGKAVVNDAALSAREGAVLKTAFGDKARLLPEPHSASEDYSEFVVAGVPSFYISLGGLDPQFLAKAAETHTPVPINLSPEFAPVPEPSIRTGTTAMSLMLLDVLQKK